MDGDGAACLSSPGTKGIHVEEERPTKLLPVIVHRGSDRPSARCAPSARERA
jgi:hypothetical protein